MTIPTHTGQTQLAGVTGWPVSHSLSPILHGLWLKTHHIDGAYVPLPIQPGHLKTAFAGLAAAGFRGWNITVPHKEEALHLMDEMSDVAARIGAVNTVICRADGTLFGDNTDAFGFKQNIVQELGAIEIPKGPAVVFGAGGAARAVVHALQEMGFGEIKICNRTDSRAQDLAAHFSQGAISVPWEDRNIVMSGAAFVVNTTTLGMQGHDPLDLTFGNLLPGAIATDIVYTPLITPFLEHARSAGYRTVDGLGMLLHQARPGFKAWFGVMPDVTDDVRVAMLSGLSKNG